MYNLPTIAKTLTPYPPITGSFSVRLDANESCFSPSPELIERIKNAVASIEFNRYPDPYATDLVFAFSNWQKSLGANVPSSLVTAGNGSDELIALLFTVFLREGETAAILSPDFSMYRFYAELNNVSIFEIPKGENYSIEPDAVIRAVNESGARMLIFSSPCNPTGGALAPNEIRRIVRGVRDCLVVLDEAYTDFCPESSLIGEVTSYDCLVILKTMSKLLGAAAARCGFAIANEALTNVLRAAKSPYNVNAITQSVCATILRDDKELDRHRAYLIANRDMLYNGMLSLKNDLGLTVYPSAANFVYAEGKRAGELRNYLAAKSISVRYFSSLSALRITAGSEREVAEALHVLGEVSKKRVIYQ